MSTMARPAGIRGPGGGRLARRIGIAAVVVYCLAPFFWMVVSSLRRPADQFSNSPFPVPVSFDNYAAAFDAHNGFGRALLNSVVVAGATTTATLIVAIFAGYALARLHFRGKTVILALVIATSMFPPITLVVPLLRLFTDAGWINTYQAMIVPSMSFALPLAVWNLTAFFRQMPTDLEKAAQVDGCTPAQAFRKVVLPLAAPGIFTTAILVFICAWNEFLIAISVVNEKQMMTANVIVSLFTGQYKHDQPFGTQMAAGVMVTLPLVIAVLVFQRRIVDGLTAGGLK
ncbi:carbohydrate ABC transporter permease [Streptomyces sp. NBC_01619]|uniref:Carbohydrate ABC transporter permease n=1 Tax=Streptomyces pratisoli TaxID=3139917 RepID=A0ACC6QSZ7_9ACTN|nr:MULTISPECIES: carbohydrate ABC transporter permease [unclassified Streptomyces]MCX4514021.1 carbohydrate ABC transporter permease [Streptomyces sp. NBC_01619]